MKTKNQEKEQARSKERVNKKGQRKQSGS